MLLNSRNWFAHSGGECRNIYATHDSSSSSLVRVFSSQWGDGKNFSLFNQIIIQYLSFQNLLASCLQQLLKSMNQLTRTSNWIKFLPSLYSHDIVKYSFRHQAKRTLVDKVNDFRGGSYASYWMGEEQGSKYLCSIFYHTYDT